MNFLAHSESGLNHENQDRVLARLHPANSHLLVCVLADGQGGQMGGGEAAEVALETAWQEASARPAKKLCDGATWSEIIVAADEAVEENERAGYATLIALGISNGRIFGASVGDSMALLVREKDFVLLTQRQRKNPPIGSSGAQPIPFSAALKSGDKLLLMSDGVWRFVGEDAIASTARNRDGTDLINALRLMQIGQNNGHLGDDFSVIAVEF
jgi:PPM family protein phosphatase